MDADWGSRSPGFIELTRRVRERISLLAGGGARYATVPLQGSGTYAVEAMLGSFVGPDDHCLVLVNGAYGRRMVEILRRLGRRVSAFEVDECSAVDPGEVARRLAARDDVDVCAVVQVETTTGVENPIEAIAAAAREAGVELLVDAMSAFGSVPVDIAAWGASAVAASANKCLEGVPGLAFVIADTGRLAQRAHRTVSLCFDLRAQLAGFEDDGQWRFTPPVQVLAALDAALDALDAEGGAPARLERYRRNARTLVAGMRARGYRSVLADAVQSPVITTWERPEGMDFDAFYDHLESHGFSIYPGKVTGRSTFRIGCIGRVFPADIERLLAVMPPASSFSPG